MARFRVLNAPFITPGPMGTIVQPGCIVDLPDDTEPTPAVLERVDDQTPTTPLNLAQQGAD